MLTEHRVKKRKSVKNGESTSADALNSPPTHERWTVSRVRRAKKSVQRHKMKQVWNTKTWFRVTLECFETENDVLNDGYAQAVVGWEASEQIQNDKNRRQWEQTGSVEWTQKKIPKRPFFKKKSSHVQKQSTQRIVSLLDTTVEMLDANEVELEA